MKFAYKVSFLSHSTLAYINRLPHFSSTIYLALFFEKEIWSSAAMEILLSAQSAIDWQFTI